MTTHFHQKHASFRKVPDSARESLRKCSLDQNSTKCQVLALQKFLRKFEKSSSGQSLAKNVKIWPKTQHFCQVCGPDLTILWSFWPKFDILVDSFQRCWEFRTCCSTSQPNSSQFPNVYQQRSAYTKEDRKVREQFLLILWKVKTVIDKVNTWCFVFFSCPEAPRLWQTITVPGLDL